MRLTETTVAGEGRRSNQDHSVKKEKMKVLSENRMYDLNLCKLVEQRQYCLQCLDIDELI